MCLGDGNYVYHDYFLALGVPGFAEYDAFGGCWGGGEVDEALHYVGIGSSFQMIERENLQ